MAVSIPLTHHEILALVAPFSRSARQIDLAASDRMARRLVFRDVTHAADAVLPGLPAMTESLQLAPAPRLSWRLTRTLAVEHGLQAVLYAEGEDPAQLLARIDAVPLAQQWHVGAGGAANAIAWEQEVLPPWLGREAHPAQNEATVEGEPQLSLRHARARVAGLSMQVRVSPVSGYPAEVELTPDPGDARVLPDDLLAVLGWPWERLDRVGGGWRTSVKLRGEDPRRSREAQSRLALTVDHLAQTLARTPAQFHREHRGARWQFALRRTSPLVFGIAFATAAISAQRSGLASDSTMALLANLAPPLLMGLFFVRREMPRLELPRWPRAPAPDAWRPWPVPSQADSFTVSV